MSIDDHMMKVVGVDSSEIQPISVDSVFLSVGERVNVIVKADKPAGKLLICFNDH